MKQRKKNFLLCIIVTVLIALTPGLSAQDIDKININKASVEELTRLQRIGAKIAQRIVEYQEKNGPFETPEDITKVKGIGSKTFELNKDRITVK
ncbi:MAG: helix-hairpin-helix domain-containing protein [Thermodesulfobacteriota bacterium]|nr:helix-hairpin-helix domain-containing protein [Thermodesulfobacteriota bacterium]